MIGTSEAARLTSLVQDAQRARQADEDQAPGAPAAAVYESQSGGIVDTLQDLREKAESQLSDLRRKETTARNNFELLEQSLKHDGRIAREDMEEAKKGIAEELKALATAKEIIKVTSKELAADVEAKGSLHQDCLSKASAFEAETKSRGEELKALATAKEIIEKATGGAFGQLSLVQVGRSKLSSGKDLHRYEAVRIIRDLARKHHSAALVQLASQMTAATNSGDAFEKVKGLISDMIAKLEKAAGADATKKAYCDKELAESNAKKSEKSDEISKLTTKIEQMAAKSSQLKEQVAALQSELSNLAKSQAQMDKLRKEEQAVYEESKAELEKGLTGVKQALKILSEYYAQDGKAHGASEGAAGGIIGLLEVVEADFSKNLAQITADEEAAVAEYGQASKAK